MNKNHEKYIMNESTKNINNVLVNMIKDNVLDKNTELIQAIEDDNDKNVKAILLRMKNNIDRILRGL